MCAWSGVHVLFLLAFVLFRELAIDSNSLGLHLRASFGAQMSGGAPRPLLIGRGRCVW